MVKNVNCVCGIGKKAENDEKNVFFTNYSGCFLNSKVKKTQIRQEKTRQKKRGYIKIEKCIKTASKNNSKRVKKRLFII